ncbi:MAG: DUF1566 domain-containing protein [Desulfobacteraceae bacterium]|nr:DUF1566 domain-containing protein [Desulfobacteraceae bacterium]
MGKKFFCMLLLAAGLTLSACAPEVRLAKLDNDMVEDTKSGLMWQMGESPTMYASREEAEKYAASLDLGGYHDWRLPSLAERWELLQIFVLKNNGTIELPNFDSRYWTTDTDKGTLPIKLGITCMCRGDQEIEYKSAGYVRAVRGPEKSSR